MTGRRWAGGRRSHLGLGGDVTDPTYRCGAAQVLEHAIEAASERVAGEGDDADYAAAAVKQPSSTPGLTDYYPNSSC